MDGTDGLVRGQPVEDMAPQSIPVGPETLGRIMNVIGGQSTSVAQSRPSSSSQSTVPPQP